jgi:hypothetical protein
LTETSNNALSISLDIPNTLLDKTKDYEVRIYSSVYQIGKFSIKPLTIEFSSADSECVGALSMVFHGIKRDSENNSVAQKFWEPIIEYFKNTKNLENEITFSTSWGDNETPLKVKSVSAKKIAVSELESIGINDSRYAKDVEAVGRITLCVVPENTPTSGNFNLAGSFTKPQLYSLRGKFIGKGLSWGQVTAFKKSNDLPKSPDDRSIDKNLDLGLSLVSAVKKDSTTNLKKRESNGILDVRFAPILNKFAYNDGPWITSWVKPIYLNANVATGKITESTLSLNRIILGTEYEFRYVPAFRSAPNDESQDEKSGSINFYRIKLSGNHASDRDFKQKEITGKVEFEPVWAKLNRPIEANWYYDKDSITKKDIVKSKGYGWQIIPKIGFEFGKTYSRRNPAEAIVASDFVQRLYGGIDMKFDITSHFTLSLSNTLYGRYELKTDRLRNYFKGEIYVPLSNPLRKTSNGLFFTFEKGDLPPFTGTVNVLKFGYRIQSNGWGGF